MICTFCNKPAIWTPNKAIYGKNFGKSFMCWYCQPCNAYVGCHNNTKKPLGTMADAATRIWRTRAHDTFDPMWKCGRISRDRAYKRLKNHFGFEVHIGAADIELCKRIIKYINEMKTKELTPKNDTKTHI